MNTVTAPHEQRCRVAVCICTYRRLQGLTRLLQALGEQRFRHLPPPRITVIVTDNEGSEQVRALCASAQGPAIAGLRYVHEPRRGISFARNSCLDQVPPASDFVAMIDDDETPVQDWLEQLLLAQHRSGADIVVGPVTPQFEAGTPAWVQACGFFDKPREQASLSDLQADAVAATCNVLLSARCLAGSRIRFHPDLALSGGEDALFFRELRLAGFRSAWARHARVFDSIPAHKARLGYMLREEYRRGNVRIFVERLMAARTGTRPPGRWRESRRAFKRIFSGIAAALGALPARTTRRQRVAMAASRAARGLGMLAALAGLKNRHYA